MIVHKKLSLIALVLLSIFAGCSRYRPPETRVVSNKTTFGVPFDKVWSAVVQIFAEFNLPLTTIDRSSGLIVADKVSVSPEYVDCGRGAEWVMTPGQVLGTYNVFVLGDTLGTTVSINMRFSRYATVLGEPIKLECVSTGVFEKKVFEGVAARLGIK